MKALSYISCIAVLMTSFSSFAEPSSEHSGKASKHSALAASHGIAGSAQVGSAVVAVPLIVVGGASLAAGSASAEVSKDLSRVADRKAKKVKQTKRVELEVTEITITVDRSPADVMKDNQ